MKYLHTMVRVSDLEKSLEFYCAKLGLIEARRYDSEQGRFTNVFLCAPGDESAQIELTYNWDPQDYGGGRNFGHLAYQVDDIYALCQRLMDQDVTINRQITFAELATGVRAIENRQMNFIKTRCAFQSHSAATMKIRGFNLGVRKSEVFQKIE